MGRNPLKRVTRTEKQISLEGIFGPEGWLAGQHPNYEYRPAQLEMAELTASALENHQHAVIEAGTGTGKTLAYLVPILMSGRRVVISAATKNLQEQLYFKDLAFLRKLFPKLKATLMKGRGNYLCRQKVYEMENEPVLSGLEEVDQFQKIRAWEKKTKTGDRAELKFLPDTSELWRRVDARRENCTGQKCPEFDRCFITEMHRQAAESELILVNHHLFFADLSLKQVEFAGLLPEYEAVVFDEAHEIEDVATQYFGLRVSNYQLDELARDTQAVLKRKKIKDPAVSNAVERLLNAADRFFAAFPGATGRFNFADRPAFLEAHDKSYQMLRTALTRLRTELEQAQGRSKDQLDEADTLIRRAEEHSKALEFLLEGEDRNYVFWWERRGRGIFVEASPIDVSGILEEQLFDRVDTVILTSATLSVGGSFDFLKKRLGIHYTRERIMPGQFDYEDQALFYIAPSLPDPRAPSFGDRAAEVLADLLEATRGRAFALFTSHQQMQALYERVRRRIPYEILLQGTAPKGTLLERFRKTPNAVLFATSSFWQGIDVQGRQLSAVVIDRLPFAVPSDPIVAARIRIINEDGGNAFTDYQIPDAVIRLKQGFGRLLRSQTDRGVVCLLDNRILRKAYGRMFLESLPPYRRTESLEELQRFMRE